MPLKTNRPKFHASKRRVILCCAAACIAFCLCISTQRSAAQSGRCTQQTIDHLETESDNIRDWAVLRSFYHRYSACQVDDAEVSQGVSESVVRMLLDHWDTLSTASRLFKQDPPFEAFALAGINITDLTDDLNHIDKLATEHCPADLHVLCQRIRQSIRDNK
jgi:hypothetical protein